MPIDLLHYEKEYWPAYPIIAGFDEAGRGAWAGPVVAAAVIFERGMVIDGVDDSKKLNPHKRQVLFGQITSHCVTYGVGIIQSDTIDTINILQATKQAMLEALSQLLVKPDLLFVDGNMTLATEVKQKSIVDGDALSHSIAAASIVAKVTRDQLMIGLATQFPGYGFDRHKGYGTKEHQQALKNLGSLPIHRHSFKPLKPYHFFHDQ